MCKQPVQPICYYRAPVSGALYLKVCSNRFASSVLGTLRRVSPELCIAMDNKPPSHLLPSVTVLPRTQAVTTQSQQSAVAVAATRLQPPPPSTTTTTVARRLELQPTAPSSGTNPKQVCVCIVFILVIFVSCYCMRRLRCLRVLQHVRAARFVEGGSYVR